MELSNKEAELINKIRIAKKNAGNNQVVMLFRSTPIGDDFIEQILPGRPKSIFSIRLKMKMLLDDLIAIDQSNSTFTITYEPGLIQIFEH